MVYDFQLLLGSFWEFVNKVPSLIFRIILVGLVFSFFWCLKNIFTNFILNLITKIFSKKQSEFVGKILSAFQKPLQLFFIFLGLYLAIHCFPLALKQQLLFSKLFRSALIFLMTWGLYNLSDVNSALFKKFQERTNLEIDQVLTSFLSKFLKAILVLISFTIIAQEWDYDINGLIAGLGLGGLALALAAKDSLANIFGGLVILLDRPFTLGDWISATDVEGTVLEIGFRSTKIRTFTQAVVTIPNTILADTAIINWSKRGKRRIDFELKIPFSTSSEKLKNCLTKIKKMLQEHTEIHPETIFVNFKDFGEAGFHLYLYFFTVTTIYGQFLEVKEDINFKILQILEEEEVEIALPGRDLYFQSVLQNPPSPH